MDKATSDRLVGTTIAQYEITARLGGGGMGIVYAARDTRLGRNVALKFLPPQWSHDEGAKQRFIREAQAASATDHRNICTIHDIATADDGQLFLVMAHYDGQTLKERLESGPLAVDHAIEIAAQIAEGLAKAHASGVVHRDIKPGNLILTEDGVKILDFGLAKFADARLKLTLEGTTIGTVAYMSPEQARGEEADVRSDVWATGVVLYEMLSGRAPFGGAYPEAIAHAIKTDVPAPLRPALSGCSEALEQLVFRTLHKERAVRFQSARDLARALRLLQGATLPLDLRTEPVPVPVPSPAPTPAPVARGPRVRVALAALAALVLVGSPLWVLWPVARVPIVIAPIVNGSGFPVLDEYRMALTEELVAALGESRTVRVVPYERLLEIVRPFRTPGEPGRDVSNREAMQALATYSGATVIVVPTLFYQDNTLRARVSVRNARSSTDEAIGDTDGVVSALSKEAAYGLVEQLARRVEGHFAEAGPRRARVASLVRSWMASPAPAPRLANLDAALLFERGLDAYGQEEYAAALRAFTDASAQDPRNPLLAAWRSRVARLMRRDNEARETAESAIALLSAAVPAADRLLVEAMTAETRRDAATESRYRALVDRFPDEPLWQMELAAFLERGTQFRAAVDAYTAALALDDRLARPRLELCRLYGPTRLNEAASARTEGERALAQYTALGARAGEAQAGLCLSDALRAGTPDDLRSARQHVNAAVAAFADLGLTYNLARAYNYASLVTRAEGNLPGAVADMERSLEIARTAGNRSLEAALLINLGVMNVLLGNRARALTFYEQSYDLHEEFGDNQFAAYSQANAGALLVEFGTDPERGKLALQNALAVVRTFGDKNFEVFCLQVLAAYALNHGQYAEAEMLLNQARSLALERNLTDDTASLALDLSRVQLATGNYAAARTSLERLTAEGAGQAQTMARIRLAQANLHLGDLDAAATHLADAAAAIEQLGDSGALPLLDLVRGELAVERGLGDEARARLLAASALWTDDFPDAASVEARALAGLIEASDGRTAAGRDLVVQSLERATRMGRVVLAARCRVILAQIDVGARRFADAITTLSGVGADAASTIGPELQAQSHYWRGQALAGSGSRGESSTELARSRQVIDRFAAALPEPFRAPFLARPGIRLVVN